MKKKSIYKTAVATLALVMGLQLTAPTADALVLHKVQKGENLYRISQKYGMSLESVMAHNDLTSDKLKTGQVLKIYNAVKVKKGDTLYSIAKKEDTDVSTLKRVNKLKSDKIKVGQVLKLHDEKENVIYITDDGTLIAYGPDFRSGTDEEEYPVQVVKVHSGETLYSIARDYDTTVKKLKSINHLKTDKVKVGQKLKVRTDAEHKALKAKITADYRKEMADLKKNQPDEYVSWVEELREWKKADPKGFEGFLKEMPLYSPVIKEIMK